MCNSQELKNKKMPLKKSTKGLLSSYIKEQGFTILNDSRYLYDEEWTLGCPTHGSFNVRIDTLKQHMNKKTSIVCPDCKKHYKLQKFSNVSFMEIEEDEIGILLECTDCHLTYRYEGDFYKPFTCHCRLKTRKQEMVLYQALHAEYSGDLAKEFIYVNNHKCDIALWYKNKIIYIEVDEIGHCYGTRLNQDSLLEEAFQANRQEYEFVFRVGNKAVENQLDAVLQEIKDFAENPTEPVRFSKVSSEILPRGRITSRSL